MTDADVVLAKIATIAVHQYQTLDSAIRAAIVEKHLGDLHT
jgi:hypothetical protein